VLSLRFFLPDVFAHLEAGVQSHYSASTSSVCGIKSFGPAIIRLLWFDVLIEEDLMSKNLEAITRIGLTVIGLVSLACSPCQGPDFNLTL
jgi:hypothetical protein